MTICGFGIAEMILIILRMYMYKNVSDFSLSSPLCAKYFALPYSIGVPSTRSSNE